MTEIDKFEFLVLGSGEAGKYLAWTMANAGHRTAVVERRWIGGSCPNIACMPSKNVIWSAKVASLSGRGLSSVSHLLRGSTWPRSAGENARWWKTW